MKIDLSIMDRLSAVLPFVKPISGILGLDVPETSLSQEGDTVTLTVKWKIKDSLPNEHGCGNTEPHDRHYLRANTPGFGFSCPGVAVDMIVDRQCDNKKAHAEHHWGTRCYCAGRDRDLVHSPKSNRCVDHEVVDCPACFGPNGAAWAGAAREVCAVGVKHDPHWWHTDHGQVYCVGND